MNLRMRTLGPPIGLSIAVWGLVAAVPAVSWVYGSLFWVVVALCAGWGLAYAMRPVTLNLSLIQLVSLMVVTAVAAAVDANDPTMLMAGMLGTLMMALGTTSIITIMLLIGSWWIGQKTSGDTAQRYMQTALTAIGQYDVAASPLQMVQVVAVLEKPELKGDTLSYTVKVLQGELPANTAERSPVPKRISG